MLWRTYFAQCIESFTDPVPYSYSQEYEFRHTQCHKVWSVFWRHTYFYTVQSNIPEDTLPSVVISLRMPVLESSISTCYVRASFVSSKADAQTDFSSLTSHTVAFLSFKGVTTALGCSEMGKHLWNRNLFERISHPYMHLLFASSQLLCTQFA